MADYTVAFSGLDNLLKSLPANTKETSYSINVTGLTKSNCSWTTTSGTLGYILNQNSTKYVDLSETILPSDLIYCTGTFYRCSTLTAPPIIPDGVKSIDSAFSQTSITTAPEIPSGVTSIETCFYNCTSLVDVSNIIIPSGVTNSRGFFGSCVLLTTTPEIPSSITSLNQFFEGCTSLQNVKINITDFTNVNVSYAFRGCPSLKNICVPSASAKASLINKLGSNDFPSGLDKDKVIKIGCNISDLNSILQSLEVNTPSTPYGIVIYDLNSNTLGSSSTEGTLGYILNQNPTKYVDIKNYYPIENVTSLNNTFNGCDNLTGVFTIPDTITDFTNAFNGCSNLTEVFTTTEDFTNISTTGMFTGCTSLELIYVPTSTARTSLINKLTSSDFPSSLDKSTVITTVIECAFSELTNWLNLLDNNTINRPYKFKITGLTASNCSSSDGEGRLGYILKQNRTKYIDLSPTTIPGYPSNYGDWNCIMSETFKNCTSLIKSPAFSNKISELHNTFEGCTNLSDLSSLVIPNTTKRLYFMFKDCASLTNLSLSNLVIPSTVQSLEYMFYNCSGLTDASYLTVPTGVTNLKYIFYYCKGLTTVSNFIIPSSVTDITGMFNSCSNVTDLTDFTIPDGVTNISGIFSGCSLITSPTIPNTVTNMSTAFQSCALLRTPKLSNNVTNLSNIFYNCTSLTDQDISSLTFPNTVTTMTNAFYGCTGLTKAPAIPSSVTGLSGIFYNCTNLTDLSDFTIPNGVTDLSNMFYNCTSLVDASGLEIPNTVTNMQSTFYNCTLLATAPVISNGVTNMQYTFQKCSSLIAAPEIPNTVTNMQSTFNGCTSLVTAPNISNAATNVNQTFYNCSSLTSAPAIPSSVTNLSQTFQGCSSLVTAPVIPNSVTGLQYTFYGCSSLTTVPSIPSSVTSLSSAFEECSVLRYVKLKINNFTSVGVSRVFTGCVLLEDIYVPSAQAKSSLSSKLTNNDFPAQLDKDEVIKYNDSIEFADLDDYLTGLTPNIALNPYTINISDLTSSDLGSSATSGSLGYILNQHQTIFVNLSSTELPDDLTSMEDSFNNCVSLVNAPEIPSSVTNMANTFYGCTNLRVILNVSSTVTDLTNTFRDCSSLTTAPSIPSTATSLYATFKNCSNLTATPTLPGTLTNMSYAFEDCSDIVTITNIPNGVTNLTNTFKNCVSLEEIPTIPNTVTNMTGTFDGCTSLTTVANIPNSVTSLQGTFHDCYSLEELPEIPDSVTNMEETFKSCTSLVVPPEIPPYVTNLQETFENCSSLESIPVIPTGVTNLTETFKGCLSLVSVPNLPDNVTNLTSTFEGCTSLLGAPKILEDVDNLSYTFSECSDLTRVMFFIEDFSDITLTGVFVDCDSMERVFVPTEEAKESLMYYLTSADYPESWDLDEIIKVRESEDIEKTLVITEGVQEFENKTIDAEKNNLIGIPEPTHYSTDEVDTGKTLEGQKIYAKYISASGQTATLSSVKKIVSVNGTYWIMGEYNSSNIYKELSVNSIYCDYSTGNYYPMLWFTTELASHIATFTVHDATPWTVFDYSDDCGMSILVEYTKHDSSSEQTIK